MQNLNSANAPVEQTSSVLAVPPGEAARIAGIGRTTLYGAIASGGLKSIKIGKRRLIAVEALRTWLLSHQVSQ